MLAGDYWCAQCKRATASTDVQEDCGATLIVCPAAILPQWAAEIAKHSHEGARSC